VPTFAVFKAAKPLKKGYSMIVLYSSATDPFSHRSRFVLFEKGMDFEIKDVDMYNKPEDIATMNPYGEVPIMVERDLILYESNIINEYIDERFPHPQLMPVDPINRSRVRLGLLGFDRELYAHVNVLESRTEKDEKKKDKARAHIRDQLTMLAPLFLKNKFFMGEDFTMLDIAIAPLLWRLTHYKIDLPKVAAPMAKYAERLFARPGFIECLTPSEKVMRR
jgi:stringent starvation protein A